MPLGDEDDDILDSNLNVMDEMDSDENAGALGASLGGTFNKTLKGMDIKAMTLKGSEQDGSDSGSEGDCIVSDRNLD
jgi:hypothetical protein